MTQTDSELALKQALPEDFQCDEVVLIPPAHRVHFRHLEVSKQQKKHLRQMAPFLMETFVAQPLEEMHFTTYSGKSSCIVAAQAKRELEYWRSILSGVVATRVVILPAQCFAQDVKEGEFVGVLGDLFTLVDGQICVLPQALLTTQQALRERSVEDVNKALLADVSLRQLNLLQGEFAPSSRLGERARSWSLVATLAMCALLVQVASMHWQARQLNLQAQDIEQQAAALYLRLVPEEGRVINLARQLQSHLNRTAEANAEPVPSTPYEMLAELDQVKRQLALKDGPQQVAYRDRVYRFEWLASSRDQLEALRKQLAQSGHKVQLDQVVRADTLYRGVFVVENK